MSWIDKMTILGIRSFGVQEEDRQVIEFEHPLTLIVGKNGAGKTTVIECLKFATTGDQPGNTRGGAFVHDPKLIGESDVRAQVALKFSSIKNNICSIRRSLQVSLKGDKITQKTLDSVIKKQTADGQDVSTTSKCSDINAEMVAALGVSKAVLENVIFCHQEDSNWPLSESKTVKTKFDEIFASTRYIKALDKIKETRKELEKSRRDEVVQLPFLEEHLKTSSEKQEKLKEETLKLNVAEDSAKKATEDTKPIEKLLKEKNQQQSEIDSMANNLEQRINRKSELEEDMNNRKRQIQNIFKGTDEELAEMISNHKTVIAEKRESSDRCKKEIGPKSREIEALSRRKSKLAIQQGELQQELKNFEEKKSNRTFLITETSGKYTLPCESVLSGEEISEIGAIEFEKQLKKKVANLVRSVNEEKKKFGKRIDEKTEERQNIWKAKTEIEESLKQKQQSVEEKFKKVQLAAREISRMQSSSDSDRLETLQNELELSTKKLQAAEEVFKEKESKTKEKSILNEKTNHESRLKEIDEELAIMQKHEQRRTTIKVFKTQKIQKEESIKKLKRKNLDTFSSIGVMDSEEGIQSANFPSAQKLDIWIMSKTQKQQSLEKILSKEKDELAKSCIKLDTASTEYQKKSQRFKEIEDKLFELCGSENFEDELVQSEDTIRELQKEKGLSDGVEYLYQEFLKKLTCSDDKSATPCPLCHRLFDQISEIEELAQEIDQKLQIAPRKRLTQDQDLERKQRRNQELLKQRPAKEEMDKLALELPNLKKEISEYKTKISKLRRTVEEKQGQISSLQNDISIAQSCSSDLNLIANLLSEIKDASRQIAADEAGLPQSEDSDKTYDELNEEKQKHAAEIQKHSATIDQLRSDRERQTKTIMSLTTAHSELQNEKLSIAANVEKCKQLNENKKLLTQEIEELQNLCQKLKMKLPPLTKQLQEIDEEKSEIVSKRDTEISSLQTAFNESHSLLQDVTRSNEEIQKYLKSGQQDLLDKILGDLQKVEIALAAKEQDLKTLHEKISLFEKDIANCRDRERDLDENVTLRKQKKSIENVTREIDSIHKKLSSVNRDQLAREIKQLQSKWHSLNRDSERFMERCNLVKRNVKELKDEMEKEHLKYAKERLRDCKQKKVTVDMTMKDLDTYHNALDRAIMRYHAAKMLEINKIIKEIWTSTYRGRDIDYIEICSDEDTGTSRMGRRNYNYRLVKCIRGQKIDMRGRCSAGQKVLASLVIRLALAETFCINCGILALDEPTTNLDRYHIESLAHALSQIIESRQMQRNFQLIVITHDEDFVELLGHSNRVDHFFRILKDDGKSKIHKCSIESL